MRKNTILSIVSIAVCFLIGYAAFQMTFLVSSWISDTLNGCTEHTEQCRNQENKPAAPRHH